MSERFRGNEMYASSNEVSKPRRYGGLAIQGLGIIEAGVSLYPFELTGALIGAAIFIIGSWVKNAGTDSRLK